VSGAADVCMRSGACRAGGAVHGQRSVQCLPRLPGVSARLRQMHCSPRLGRVADKLRSLSGRAQVLLCTSASTLLTRLLASQEHGKGVLGRFDVPRRALGVWRARRRGASPHPSPCAFELTTATLSWAPSTSTPSGRQQTLPRRCVRGACQSRAPLVGCRPTRWPPPRPRRDSPRSACRLRVRGPRRKRMRTWPGRWRA
jgi:hypothetical protein